MPTAQPDSVQTTPGTPVTIAVLANDTGTGLQLIGLESPAFGRVVLNADQSLTYTPNTGFAGVDSFGYTVRDAANATAQGLVTVTVRAANRAPVASNDQATTLAGQPVVIPVLANDNDPDGDTLGLSALTGAGHGTLAVNPGQTITYTPGAGYVGSDVFQYTVTDGHGGSAGATVSITVTSPNRPPTAASSQVTTTAGTGLSIDLLAGASDPDGDQLRLTNLASPGHGTLTLQDASHVLYTPAAGYTGTDGFDFTIGDGRGGTAVGHVAITVTPAAPPNLFGFDFEGTGTPSGLTLAADAGSSADPDAPTVTLSPAAPAAWGAQYLKAQAIDGQRAYALWQPASPQPAPLYIECGVRCIAQPVFASNGDYTNLLRLRFSTAESLADGNALTLHLRIGRYALGSSFDYRWAWAIRKNGAQLATGSIASATQPVTNGGHYALWIALVGPTLTVSVNDTQLCQLTRDDWLGIDEIRMGANAHLGATLKACTLGFDRLAANVQNFPSLLAPLPPDTTAPTAPTGLTATAVSSSRIDLGWTASSDDVGVTGYEVFRGGTKVADAAGTTWSDTGLAPSTAYAYQVRAKDAAGNLSAFSATAGATTQAGSTVVTLRSATGIVVTYDPTYGFASRNDDWYGLRSIQGLLSKMAYAPPGQMTTALRADGTPWIYDHSPAGIAAGGDKLGAFAESRYNQYGTRMVWVDIEQWNSKNVPDPLSDGTSYSEATDGYLANTDYLTSRVGLRDEVVRFRLGVLQRAKAYLAGKGLGFVEFADYNLPRKFNIAERAVLATDSRIAYEPVHFGDYTDALDAMGPQAQLLVRDVDRIKITQGTGSGLSQAECVEWFVNGCRTRLQAYATAGRACRILATVWPIIYVPGGTTQGVMPAGMMTSLLDGLYGVGVRRFGVFQWHDVANVWNDDALRDAAHASYAELAAWVLAKGSEVQKVGA